MAMTRALACPETTLVPVKSIFEALTKAAEDYARAQVLAGMDKAQAVFAEQQSLDAFFSKTTTNQAQGEQSSALASAMSGQMGAGGIIDTRRIEAAQETANAIDQINADSAQFFTDSWQGAVESIISEALPALIESFSAASDMASRGLRAAGLHL